jgi:hypothetical protein
MMDNNREYVLCAAIYFNDGQNRAHLPRNVKAGIVVAGRRHHNCFAQLTLMFPGGEYRRAHRENLVQGFLTSEDQFVTREEAALLALAAGQIQKPLPRLFSEDLY